VRRGAIDNRDADDLQGQVQGHPRSNITVSAKMSGNARSVGLELTYDFRGSRQSQHNPKHRLRTQTCMGVRHLKDSGRYGQIYILQGQKACRYPT
jgi:hypothetical protein